MIIYFLDRQLSITGTASTSLPGGFRIEDDITLEQVDSGVTTFECNILYNDKTRIDLEAAVKAGMYVLKGSGRAFSNKEETYDSIFQIIETEFDTAKQTLHIYAEDAGLDLLNKVCGEKNFDEETSMKDMLDYFLPKDWTLIIENAPTDKKTNEWTGDSTCTERIRSVAALWDYEIYYSFDVDRFKINAKNVHVVEKRGDQTASYQLRLGEDINEIVRTTSIAELATAYKCKGGTATQDVYTLTKKQPSDWSTNYKNYYTYNSSTKKYEKVTGKTAPTWKASTYYSHTTKDYTVTLKDYDYSYDDPETGDHYAVDKDTGQMRNVSAMKRWASKIDPDGLILKRFEYDTVKQARLAGQARAALQKVSKESVNYEVNIIKLPDGAHIGDRINIVDDDGGLYLEARLLEIETSVANAETKITLGDYKIKDDGISSTVYDLLSSTLNKEPTAVINIAYTKKDEVVYEQVISENAPTDWETYYKEYYEYDSTTSTYKHVTGDSAPEFTEGTYYLREDYDLVATVVKGETVITTQEGLEEEFGSDAHLYWCRIDADGTVIRLSEGFVQGADSLWTGAKYTCNLEVEAELYVLGEGSTDLSVIGASIQLNNLSSLVEDLKTQVDKKIVTYRQADAPTEDLDVGDLWFDTDDSTTWRWDGENWVAYDCSEKLFDEVDKKATIYYGTPAEGTELFDGDYYVDDSTGDWYIYNGTTKKWVVATNLSAVKGIAESAKELAETAKEQVDAKIETWRQSSDPSTSWSDDEKPSHVGDLLYWTGNSTTSFTKNCTYRYSSSYAWEAYDATEELFDEIDGKKTIYYGSVSGSEITINNLSNYFTQANGTYYFSYSGGVWGATNLGVDSSTAETTFTAKKACKIKIACSYITEASYDKVTLTAGGTTLINASSGSGSYESEAISLSANQTVYMKYAKDSSQSATGEKVNFNIYEVITPNEGDYLIDTDGNTYKYNGSSWDKVVDISGIRNDIEELQGEISDNYAECSSAGTSQIKDITLDNFTLEDGVRITIKFSNANSYSGPYIRINSSTSYYPIYMYNNAGTLVQLTSNYSSYYWQANTSNTFTFDAANSRWIMDVSSAKRNIIDWCSANATLKIDGSNLVASSVSCSKLYGDTLTLGGAGGVAGNFVLNDADNVAVVTMDYTNGIVATQGTIGGWSINATTGLSKISGTHSIYINASAEVSTDVMSVSYDSSGNGLRITGGGDIIHTGEFGKIRIQNGAIYGSDAAYGQSQPIGFTKDIITGGSITPTTSWARYTTTSYTLKQGTWIITLEGTINPTSEGRIGLAISTSTSSIDGEGQILVPASTSNNHVQAVRILNVTASTPIYIFTYSSGGGTFSRVCWRAVRII